MVLNIIANGSAASNTNQGNHYLLYIFLCDNYKNNIKIIKIVIVYFSFGKLAY